MSKQRSLPIAPGAPLGDILLACGTVNEEQLSNAREKAVRKVRSLEHILREEKIVTDELLRRAVNEQAAPWTTDTLARCSIPSFFGKRAGKRMEKFLKRLCEERVKWNAFYAARRAENELIRTERAKRRAIDAQKEETKRLQRENERQKKLEEQRKQKAERRAIRKEERQARIDAARKRKEEERTLRVEAQKLRKEKKREMKEARARRAAENALRRMLKKTARREERTRRRRDFMKRISNMLTRKEAVRKDAEKEQHRLIEEARREATKQVLIEKEKKNILQKQDAPLMKSQMTAEDAQGAIGGVSTVLIDSPEKVFVAPPRNVAKEDSTEEHLASSDDRGLFYQEKRALLARISQLERAAAGIPVAAKQPTAPADGYDAFLEKARAEFEAKLKAQATEFEMKNAAERVHWETEKERVRQQAIADTEREFIANIKGGDAPAKEIVKQKVESERLEKERLKLEQAKTLQAEQERMRGQKRKMEDEKLKLEREKIALERRALEIRNEHEESAKTDDKKTVKKKELPEETKRPRTKEQEKKMEQKDGKKSVKKDEEREEQTAKVAEAPTTTIDVGTILVAQHYLEQAELEEARKRATERNVSVENILREDGLVTRDIIQNAIAEYYRMPFVDVGAEPLDTGIVEILPETIATELRTTAIEKRDDGTLVVATYAPERGEEIKKRILEEVKGIKNIEMVYTSKDAIDAALAFYRKPLNTRFQSIIEEHRKIAPEIIEEIFADAIQLGASDIHFEPQEQGVIVRFRVDGVMHEAGRLPREYYEGIVNRIKIAGNMRIDEHFAAQDGAIRWRHGDKAMDVRVSIVPIVDGEKIVMRLLSEYVRTLTLRDLGFSTDHLNALVQASHKPFGMILTTGPTGSGKSTTLYGLMKIRNSPDVNISTIEDPVEYKILGINHIQVNVKANLTFERGLRALVRQDPDIILVGEIRDDITAQISVNAALTGHLLFSTIHANDAATAVPRLLEMGIEPYLLASTLEVIIAQRLMRRICLNCRYSANIPESEAQKLFPNAELYFTDGKEVTLYRGKGCPTCGGTGFKGRVGIYELLTVTPEIEEMITNRRTSGEINILARRQGMLTLFEDGLEKVLAGLSTIDELQRIAAPPDPLSAAA